MRVLYTDNQLMRWGGQLHLENLSGTWCVVGPGCVCTVATIEEGNQLMALLRASGEQRGVLIEYQ